MNTLSQLLTQSHSAVLEELRARFLDESIELGLPKRLTAWTPADSSERKIYGSKIDGYPAEMILLSALIEQDHEQTAEVLANVLRILGIMQISGTPHRLSDLSGVPIPNCIIWMPIFLPNRNERYDLGLLA